MSSTVEQGRILMSLLQVLMGSYATNGYVTVRSTGPTGVVPAYSYAIPLFGSLNEDATIRVEKNPATADGSWLVTSAGTPVPVSALLGGPIGNLPLSTLVRWDEPLSGIEEFSQVTTALSGGAFLNPSSGPVLRQVKLYRELGPDVVKTLFAAQAGADTPSAVLAWASSGPADGTGSPAMGLAASRVREGSRIWKNNWLLWLVTSRFESTEIRRREGDTIRDLTLSLLTDREAWRGVTLSLPQGLQIVEASVFKVLETSYVDLIRFSTSYTLTRRDERVFNEWVTSRIRLETAEQPPGSKLFVPDIKVPMP